MAVPMTVATEGAAGNLVPSDFETTVIDLTVGASEVLSRIPAANRYFLERVNDTVPVTYTGLTPTFITEGQAKPVSQLTWIYAPLNGVEMAVMTAATDKLLDNGVINFESAFTQSAIKGFAKVLDDALVQNAPTGWDVPSALGGFDADFETCTVQTGQIVNGGGSVDDTAKFFSAILALLEANENWDQNSTVWFVRRSARQAFRDGRTSNGEPLFVPDPSNQDGRAGSIYGLPVQEVMDSKFPTNDDVYCVDMSKVLWGAKADSLGFAKSDVASWVEGETTHHAFQENATAYKWFGMYAFTIIDPQAVAVGRGIENAVPAP